MERTTSTMCLSWTCKRRLLLCLAKDTCQFSQSVVPCPDHPSAMRQIPSEDASEGFIVVLVLIPLWNLTDADDFVAEAHQHSVTRLWLESKAVNLPHFASLQS